VSSMRYMFEGASDFNQNLCSWDYARAENVYSMFTKTSCPYPNKSPPDYACHKC